MGRLQSVNEVSPEIGGYMRLKELAFALAFFHFLLLITLNFDDFELRIPSMQIILPEIRAFYTTYVDLGKDKDDFARFAEGSQVFMQ